MTRRERDRLVALMKAGKKLITQKQAAQQIGLSERRCGGCWPSAAAKATRWSRHRNQLVSYWRKSNRC